MNKYNELEQLDVMELEEVVKQSPWFGYAQHLLLLKLYTMGEEIYTTHLRKSAIFLSSREALYNKIIGKKGGGHHEGNEYKREISSVAHVNRDFTESNSAHPKRRVIVAGADFFSKEELSAIPDEENMELKLKGSKFYREEKAVINKNSIISEDGKINYDDLAFYTETLGHIYAQQHYYDKAIEVFSKLILLYPQKNTYFATLIREIEKNKEL